MNKNHFEIERKYLIRYPSVDEMGKMKDYEYSHIDQTYISIAYDNMHGRVRKRGKDGNFTYTKTYKKSVSAATRVEIENEISLTEYNELLKSSRPGYNTVKKTRHTFSYMGLTYEIDIYPFWNDRAIMECEVSSEETYIPTPPCIEIIREVTEDRRYRNASMAANIITDEID